MNETGPMSSDERLTHRHPDHDRLRRGETTTSVEHVLQGASDRTGRCHVAAHDPLEIGLTDGENRRERSVIDHTYPLGPLDDDRTRRTRRFGREQPQVHRCRRRLVDRDVEGR